MQRAGRARIARAGRGLGRPQRIGGAPADRGHARLPDGVGELRATLGLRLGAQPDDVGELGDRIDVAQRGQAREPQGVEPVAGEQGEVGLDLGEQPRGAVMQQLALADGLDDEGDVGLVARRPRARGSRRAEGAVRARFGAQRLGEQAALGREGGADGRERRQGSSRKAAAAASTVSSTCSASCASDGNQASNCDGGG